MSGGGGGASTSTSTTRSGSTSRSGGGNLFWKPAPHISTFSQQQEDAVLRDDFGGSGNLDDGNGGAAGAWLQASLGGSGTGSSRRSSSGQRAPPPPLSISQHRMLLPIHKHRRQILYAVEEHDVVVVVGETGCGKSTQLPQYLAEPDSGWTDHDFCVLCTQPRRIAAVTLARRVAYELGNTELGHEVGYHVQFQRQFSPGGITKIKYVTDGILLREATLEDPLLSNYSVVIVDEAHERTLNSDAVLGLLKKIRRKRKDLRVVICSATIDAQAFADFFAGRKKGGEDDGGGAAVAAAKTTIISVDGRQYPVDVMYLSQPAQNYVRAAVETVYKIHRQGEEGEQRKAPGAAEAASFADGSDILCFLPTPEDVDEAVRMSEQDVFSDILSVDFLPLYGTLPYHLQARVFQAQGGGGGGGGRRQQQQPGRGSGGRNRRVIFATNIAETSVTVPNIGHVIDSGLAKLPYFDPNTAMERSIVAPISQASATQRAGRAGRIQSGKCYRLYKESYFVSEMKPQTPPEILRTNLTSFILTLKALGVDNILAFDLMDVPSVDALSHGLETLYALGAIDDRTSLTQLGFDMSTFPTDPRVARMLLESLSNGCSWEVLGVAGALQVRDLFFKPRKSQQQQPQIMLDYETAMSEVVDRSGDHVTYANLLAEMDDRDFSDEDCKERFINYYALKRALDVRRQLSGVLRKFGKVEALGLAGDDGQVRSKAIRKCVTAGFFVNVAKLANDGRYYTLRKNVLVSPSPSSSVFGSSFAASRSMVATVSEYIVFGETFDGPRGGIELKSVSSIEARWLRELAPDYWE